jgi:hypothetical protein
MKVRPSADTTLLVGGALLGVAAMYFMDPAQGGRRRRRVAAAAEGAYGHAREAVGDRLHHLSGHVKDLAHRVTEHVGALHQRAAGDTQALADEARAIAAELTHHATAHLRDKQAAAAEYGHHAGDIGHRLWESARGVGASLANLGGSVADQAHGWGDELLGRAKGWRHWASGRAADAQSQAKSWLRHEEQPTGVGATAVISTALGFCAVGAGAMYFMDPLRGRTRREQVWNQTSEMVCNTGKLMRATGKDLANRFHGIGRSVAARYGVDSRQLIDDIRSRIGNWIANPNDIQFLADADGSITITGNILRNELDSLLAHLHDVPGVSHVINRLHVREPAPERKSDNNPASASA